MKIIGDRVFDSATGNVYRPDGSLERFRYLDYPGCIHPESLVKARLLIVSELETRYDTKVDIALSKEGFVATWELHGKPAQVNLGREADIIQRQGLDQWKQIFHASLDKER